MQAGQHIDHYTIQRPLGSGGMADVYLAWDQKNQWPVALKLMNAVAMSHPNAAGRFKRDVDIASRLRHPHLVQVYGWGQMTDGRLYMVMEYIAGGTLADRLRQAAAARQTIPPQEAAYLMRRVAAAMAYVHGQDIIHRDLKPGNILIRADSGEPVVTDFGIAADASARKLTGTMEMLGTIPYMAPEQAQEATEPDSRADVYAMGVMLYEMLSGRLPFDSDNVWAVLNMKMTRDPLPLRQVQPRLTPELAAIVDRCLQRQPDARYASAAALAGALDQVIPTNAGPPPPPPPPHPSPPARGVSPWLVGGGLAAALLLLWLLVGALRPPPPPVSAANTPTSRPIVTATLEEELAVVAPTLVAAARTATSTPAARATIAPTATATEEPPPTATMTPTPTVTPILETRGGPEPLTIGFSARNSPVEAVRFGNGPRNVVFVGGLSAGFAPGTVNLAQQTINHFTANPEHIPDNLTVTIIISASPDTVYAPGELPGRLNSNGVDANRNWGCRWAADPLVLGRVVRGAGGSAPFSEPEVRALADFLTAEGPVAVVFWVARARNGLVSPGSCAGASDYGEALMNVYAAASGYVADDFEELTDQELNGDATNWLDSIGIPAISVLLREYEGMDWRNNLAGIEAVLAYASR